MKKEILEYLMTASGYSWLVIILFFIGLLFLAFQIGQNMVWREVNSTLRQAQDDSSKLGGRHD